MSSTNTKDGKTLKSSLFERYPSAIILMGLLNGIIVILSDISSLPARVSMSALVSAIVLIFMTRKNSLKFYTFTIIGLLLSLLCKEPSSTFYGQLIRQKNCGAQIRATIVDASCVGSRINWIPPSKLLKVNVLEMRFTPEDRWRKVTGNLAVRLPSKENTSGIQYGNTVEFSGFFSDPEPARFRGEMDFGDFLESRNLHMLFRANTYHVVENKPSIISQKIFKQVLSIRDLLLYNLTNGIENIDHKHILAALVFGCKQGLSREGKHNFLMSGTIHLFTVSGLHVGMLALLLFWVFRWIPFRTRYFIVPLLLLIYVFTTGMQPAAVRALLMISVWSFFRGNLYSIATLNTVFLSAAIILMYNPFYFKDMGVQYSFITVGFLIGSVSAISRGSANFTEIMMWVPSKRRPWLKLLSLRVTRIFFASLAGCIIAWLASSGVTMLHRGLYIPFAFLVNLLLLPLTWFLFIASGVKLFVCSIPGLSYLANCAIEIVLNVITGICEFFASAGGSEYIPLPPLWTLVLFYFLLLMLIVSRKRFIFLTSLIALVVVCGFWNMRRALCKDEVVVMCGGGSQEPTIVFASPLSGRAIVVNAPWWDSSWTLSSYLHSIGINKIETLLICENQKAYCAGAGVLFNSDLRPSMLLVPRGYARSSYVRNSVKLAKRKGSSVVAMSSKADASWHYSTPRFNASSENGIYNFAYNTNKGKLIVYIYDGDTVGSKFVYIIMPSGKKILHNLTNSSQISIHSNQIE